MSRAWTFLQGRAPQFAVDVPQYRLSITFGEKRRKREELSLEMDNGLSISQELLLHRGLEDELSTAPKGIIKSLEICNS